MPLVAVILLGFALRLLRLPSLGDLEFDEIVSVRYAAMPAGALLPRLAGALFEHPPAFYVALGWWQALAGREDVLARLFSIVPGMLAIPLAYAIARQVYGGQDPRDAAAPRQGTAVLAATLVALAPLPIFYSREARMYALLTCLSLASLWLLLRGLARQRSRWHWAAYTVVGALAAYVHYLGALLVLAQLGVAVALRRHAPHAVRPVALATGVIVAAGAPWVAAASGSRASLPALSLDHLRAVPAGLVAIARELAAGPDAGGPLATIAGAALAVLAGAGLLEAARRPAGQALAASLLAGLAGLLFVLALGKPVQARYVLPVAPLLYVAAAGALARARRPLPLRPVHQQARRGIAALAMGSLAAGFLAFGARYYVAYARADYSDVTRRIQALERPGDVVLLTGPWQAWYFDYYYRGQLGHHVLPKDAPPALEPAQAAAELQELLRSHRRLWFVQAGLAQADPTNYVERWLHRHAWPAFREAYQNAVLSCFALEPPAVTRPLRPVVFGETLRLAGGWVDAQEVTSGDVVRLLLEFEVLRPTGDLKASLRLVGSDGQRTAVDFDLVDRAEPGDRPASQWRPGERVRLQRGVWTPPGMAPQPYEVRLVVYDPSTLAPLRPDGALFAASPGGEAPVGEVYVTQSLAALPPAPAGRLVVSDHTFGGGDDFDAIRLRGVRWLQDDPSAAPVQFDLIWQLKGVSGTEHRATLTVVDERGRIWAEQVRPLFGATFAMSQWRDGETLAERHALALQSLPAGRYRIVLGLQDARARPLPVDAAGAALQIGQVEVPYRRPWLDRLRTLIRRGAEMAGL
jgi:4-amino-4-deoxy-L-arabinose transferase-like glycosyltransferase